MSLSSENAEIQFFAGFELVSVRYTSVIDEITGELIHLYEGTGVGLDRQLYEFRAAAKRI